MRHLGSDELRQSFPSIVMEVIKVIFKYCCRSIETVMTKVNLVYDSWWIRRCGG